MVNHERVRRKLPELLVDGSVSQKQFFNQYKLYQWHLRKMEKKQPFKLDMIVKNITDSLRKLEQELSA